MGGPKELGLKRVSGVKWPGSERFGTIANTRIQMPAGRWRIKTLSDDGVRVRVNGRVVVENWKWHGPTIDSGLFELERETSVELVAEHFEIDGYSVLRVELEPEGQRP
jgi:hypothetical protein